MKNQDQEESIVYKVQLLEDLVQRQQNALKIANNLLDLKGRLVELCEEEVEIYKAENKRLRKSLIILCGALILNLIIHLVSLAY
jgi:hypothetical protein